MNKKLIFAGLLLLIVGILLFDIIQSPASVSTRVILAGTEGLPVRGHYSADGNEYSLDEVLPAEIIVPARHFSLLVESSEPSEAILARVYVNDQYKVSGAQRKIEVTVKGRTMFSSPRVYLRASSEEPGT